MVSEQIIDSVFESHRAYLILKYLHLYNPFIKKNLTTHEERVKDINKKVNHLFNSLCIVWFTIVNNTLSLPLFIRGPGWY